MKFMYLNFELHKNNLDVPFILLIELIYSKVSSGKIYIYINQLK
jgi:hypothetical protein